jgi:hypothetical protein
MADNSPAALLQKAVMKAISQPQASQALNPSCPAASNPAIARCLQAYADARKAALSAKKLEWDVNRDAKAAYRNAMPPLTGARNIRDFVTCVAHAMALNAIDGPDGARLLYAAQAASTAHIAHRRKKSKSSALSVPRTPTENEHLLHPILPASQAK